MTIKELINNKIKEYKEDFYNSTGLQLIALPTSDVPRIDLYTLAEIVCEYYNIDINILNTNLGRVSTAKDAIIAIATKMGYSYKDIGKRLGISHATVHSILRRFRGSFDAKPYRVQFYVLLEHLYNATQNDKHIKNMNWHEKEEHFDTVFANF